MWSGALFSLGPELRFPLESVTAVRDPGGRPAVDVALNPDSGFGALTETIGIRPLAVMADDEVVIVLRVQSAMHDAVRLVGNWTPEEATALAARLRTQRGAPTSADPIRGSERINVGRPTMELAVLLRPGDEFWDTPTMVLERDGEELRFGPIASFEVSAVYPTQDRDGEVALGYRVVDGEAYRAYTRAHTGRQVGIFVAEELFGTPEIEAEIPGQGVVTGGTEGLSDAQWAMLREHFAALLGGAR